MESYKSKQLPYIETEKYIISKESPKKILLNSEKIKEITTTPSRVPSGISTSQEYQIKSKTVKIKIIILFLKIVWIIKKKYLSKKNLKIIKII